MTKSDPAKIEDFYAFILCGQLVTIVMMVPAKSKHCENHLNESCVYDCIGINKKEDETSSYNGK